jgi:hypothetical protein
MPRFRRFRGCEKEVEFCQSSLMTYAELRNRCLEKRGTGRSYKRDRNRIFPSVIRLNGHNLDSLQDIHGQFKDAYRDPDKACYLWTGLSCPDVNETIRRLLPSKPGSCPKDRILLLWSGSTLSFVFVSCFLLSFTLKPKVEITAS